MSWPRTLATDTKLMRALAVHPEDNKTLRETTMVFAPCCGRRTPADTVVSLEGLKTEIRAGNHRPKTDLSWACDGCLHLLIIDPTNGWTRSKLFRALGAPASVIRHERAREIQHEVEKRAGPEGINPQREYERAHASLPANVRELHGTERPDV